MGLERSTILALTAEKFSNNIVKLYLEKKKKSGAIKAIKKHPLIYIIDENFLSNI